MYCVRCGRKLELKLEECCGLTYELLSDGRIIVIHTISGTTAIIPNAAGNAAKIQRVVRKE